MPAVALSKLNLGRLWFRKFFRGSLGLAVDYPSSSDTSRDRAASSRSWSAAARNDRRVHDGAGSDAEVFARQIVVHRIQNLAASFMPLQHAAGAKARRLIRRDGTAQVEARKVPQHGRLIQRILGAWIGEIEPLLREVDAHPCQPN